MKKALKETPPTLKRFESVYIAVFNTYGFLIQKAAKQVVERHGQEVFDAEVAEFVENGVMGLFRSSPVTAARQDFAFTLAVLTDDFEGFSDEEKEKVRAEAEAEKEDEDAKKFLTADGQDSRKLRTLYFVNKDDLKIEDFPAKKVVFVKDFGCVLKKDKTAFDFALGTIANPADFFGSLSSAQVEFEKYLKELVALREAEVKTAESLLKTAKDKLSALQMDKAPYLKQSSGRKPETLGGVRF